MKSLSSLALLAALAFYVVWPGYTGYEIKTAFDAQDPARLTAKIDFPSLRASLRPAVAANVEKLMTDSLRKAGPAAGPLTDELRAKLMPGVIDSVLATLVTPESLIRIYAQGLNVKDAINVMTAERIGQADIVGAFLPATPSGSGSDTGFGNLGKLAEKVGIDPGKVIGGFLKKKEDGGEAKVEAKAGKPAPSYGFDNIKKFGLNGPLGISVGVARDPKATAPDLTAEMGFIDGDWKLTGLIPRV